MIHVEHFWSDKNSEWLVQQYEAYRFYGGSHSKTDKFIPRPHISLVFHFKDPAILLGEEVIMLQSYFLAPIVRKAITLQFHGNMDTLAISCKPTVFSKLFHLNLLPDGHREIALPDKIFYPLWEELAAAENTENRISVFSNFINSIQSQPYEPDAVDILYDSILQKSITSPLKDMMKESFASRSTLLRNFEKRTGVNPKMLARIVRIDYLWRKIMDERAIDFQDLAFEGKYFDQAHFINDFRSIVGETPGYFFARNLNIVKAFSGTPTSEKK